MDTIPYGLLTLQKQPVPLKDISVSVHVKGILADVTATLLYKNELQDPLEAVFVFPMDDEAAVYNFEALIDGKTITAEIKEKDIARQVYDDAISSGQQAFLLEEDVTSDVFSCTVGNLPPEKEAAVSISYVIQLSLEADQALRFVLPAVLNPRYTPADCPSKSVIGNIPRGNADDLPYMLHLSLKVEGAQEIQSIKSNCELTDIVYNANMKTSAQISLKEGHKFDRDVEILIYYRDPCLPYALVEKGKPEAAEGTIMSEPMVMLNMYPEMGSGEENTHQDFIFVVDRSGSMQSNVSRASQQSRIATAKDTLVLLLKSLRVGCLFNIYGFGNSFTSFFKSSVEYNQESMDSALEKLKNFEADLGGTEILKPLKDIFSKSVKTGYHRQVFLLTDGEVNNTANVIEEVKNHATTHRFFTLGIGEGASTSLIKGMAKASHGKYEFITGKDRMQKKVLKCLKLAYQPSATNISLEWKVPSAVEPLVVPRVPEVVFHQQRTVIYAQLKELENSDTEETQAVLKYSCGEKKYQCVLDFTLTAEDSDSQSIHYMAAKAIIKDGEGTSEGVVPKDDIDRITKISIESNVISPYTAYTAVHKDSKEPVRGPMVQQIIPLYNSTLFCGSPGENLREYNLDCSTRQYLREYNLDLKKVEETKQIPVRGKSSSKKKKGGCFPIKLPKLGSFRVSKKAESKKVKEDHQDDTKELEDEGLTETKILKEEAIIETKILKEEAIIESKIQKEECQIESKAVKEKSQKGSKKGKEKSQTDSKKVKEKCLIAEPTNKEDQVMTLIGLQKADGSWIVDEVLAEIFNSTTQEILTSLPCEEAEPAVWSTLLSLIWLHTYGAKIKSDWELLASKAVSWLNTNAAGVDFGELIIVGNNFLKTEVKQSTLGL